MLVFPQYLPCQHTKNLFSYLIMQCSGFMFNRLYCSHSTVSFEASDALLIRDLIYVFQGIDGKLIKYDQVNDGYRIERGIGVSYTTRALVNKLSELGWLFTKIRRYLDARAGDKALGLVGQSFCAALQLELTEYYRLIAVFEAQQQHLTDAGLGDETCSNSLTLRRLLVWTYTPLLRLKTLAALVEICKGA